MEPDEKPLRRKIIRGVAVSLGDGLDLTGGEEEMALRLSNVYEAERRRHVSMSRSSDHAYTPNAFNQTMGEIRAAKKWGTSENIEDNPGGEMRRPPKVDIWFKIARKVLLARYDPDAFVRRQFSSLPPGDSAPTPEALLGNRADTNYHEGQNANKRTIELALRLQVDTCRVEITRIGKTSLGLKGEQAWAMVLEDRSVEMTALFRYCMAVSLVKSPTTVDKAEFQRIAERFKSAAAMQYVFDADSYSHVWGDKIPLGFREESDIIYRRFHHMDGTITATEEF